MSISTLGLELLFSGAVLAYGAVLSRFIPSRLHWPANLLAAVLAIGAGHLSGLSFTQMGLRIFPITTGLRVTVAVSLIIFLLVLGANAIPFLHRRFLDQLQILHSPTSRLVYISAVRIPLSTALTEEIFFRGVLLGLFMHYNPTVVAVVLSSIVFGLWHIFPTLSSLRSTQTLRKDQIEMTRLLKSVHVAGHVAATFAAGIVFAWFRILSGNILAPWLLHWTINASGVAAVIVAGQIRHRGIANRVE